jgi:formylglycine-generating enzyme required for sulfatase activity
MEEKRTLVRMDAKGYSDLADDIEYMAGPTGVSTFNSKIRELIEDVIHQIGREKGEIVRQEGDGFLVSFLIADDAHLFANLFHQNFARWNIPLKSQKDEILYRIGCSTGILEVSTYSGCVATRAYRLEPKAQPGGTLIDTQTYDELSVEYQTEYDIEEIIEGKRTAKFHARRWLGNLGSQKALLKDQGDAGIITRILDVPKIPDSLEHSFETITLNAKAEIVRREPRTANYLIESIQDQELRMFIIPTGEYGMGSSERKGRICEKPQHQVKIAAFFMSQYPITKAQWKIVASWPMVKHSLKKITSREGAMNYPVVNVSWHEAVEFCDRLSQKTGHIYRLPTEAEWEYACRGGTTTPFHFGETITSQYVNYDATIKYRTEAQGIYRKCRNSIGDLDFPNSFGLCDMHGNVWEWCLDHWHNTYKSAPLDGQAWLDRNGNLFRVVRGGSWSCEPHLCTSFYRYSHNESDNLSRDIGFRVVRAMI